jgi:AraC-like DNA-binding protein
MPQSLRTQVDSLAAPTGGRFVILPRSALILFREQGADVEALAREVGAASASARLSPAQAEELVKKALDRVGHPELGLRAGASVRPELFGVAGFAAMSAPTLGEAFARLARFKRILWIDTLALVPVGEGLSVRAVLASVSHARLLADFELAFVIAFARVVTNSPELVPVRVGVRGTAPSYRQRYEALFRCPIEFDAPEDEVIFATSDLTRALVSHAPELAPLFDERAEQLLAESTSERAGERVRAALRQVRGEVPYVRDVARALGMSVRSLQRHLSAEGTSFAELLDDTRREVAHELLVRTDSDLAEISFLLGFVSPDSFYRAFKRWWRTTPLAHRRAHRSAAQTAK